MIEFKSGDILAADAEVLVNTVNCVGIMGRGIALQFKRAFPANFKAYAAQCRAGEVRPGRMFVYSTEQLTNPRFIINFPTKRHWRGKSRIEDIERGLEDLARVVKRLGVHSVAVPPLGSGLGGLDWPEVRSRIEDVLGALPGVRVTVFEPHGAPTPGAIAKPRNVPKMTPGRAALIGLIDRYLAGSMDPVVTLLEIHKLMYFMQEAGERLRLRYVSAPYGPYAENLRHVLTAIEGYYIAGYADGGDEPGKALTLVPGAVEDAAEFLEAHPPTRARFERVANLVEGFETPFGLELLATVQWIATREDVANADDVVSRTYDWSPRKRRFSESQIRFALDHMARAGWVPPLDAAEADTVPAGKY